MQGLYSYGKSDAPPHGTHLLKRVNTFSFYGTGGYFFCAFFARSYACPLYNKLINFFPTFLNAMQKGTQYVFPYPLSP